MTVEVLSRAIDPQSRQSLVLYVKRPAGQPNLGRPALAIQSGGLHRPKRKMSAKNDNRLSLLEGVRGHQPSAHRAQKVRSQNDNEEQRPEYERTRLRMGSHWRETPLNTKSTSPRWLRLW